MDNLIVIHIFNDGGWIMWPILATSLVALSLIVERLLWWEIQRRRHEPAKLQEVYNLLAKRKVDEATAVAGTSDDAVLRVLWFGLSHKSNSLQGALQAAAGIELSRAGRFLVGLDTVVTLAPLLGLLGTVTGLMRAFFKLGTTELTERAIGGGIAEALIATACGLSIAVVALVFLNYFAAKIARLQFELQTACGRVEVLLNFPMEHEETTHEIGSPLVGAPDSSSLTPPSFVSPEGRNPPTIS
jgi:biopolymer transport protein ExbB